MEILSIVKKSFLILLPILLMTDVHGAQFVVDVAYQIESGDYGSASTTDVTRVPLQLKYFDDVWSFAIEVPYLMVSGDATVVPGIRGQSSSNGQGAISNNAMSTTQSVTRSGLGDAQLSLSRAFFRERPDGIFYEITGALKLATGNEKKSLGSGEIDYSIKLSISSETGRWMPGLSFGYQLTGDKADTDFNDVWFLSAGTGYRLDQGSSLSASVDFEQAVSDGADDFSAIKSGLLTRTRQSGDCGYYAKSRINR